MRYGKSMYRGGLVVDAVSCDYESSRQLGIVCPFCSEAVYLKKSFQYVRDGKEITASAAFCHYHSDSPTAQACELRSLRRDGEEYIRSLEAQARGQRLELYNKRLWEFIKNEIETTYLNEVPKNFGKAWIEKIVKLARIDLSKHLDLNLEKARRLWQEQLTRGIHIEDPAIAETIKLKWTSQKTSAEIRNLNPFDRQLYYLILEEVINFLATHTGRYAYEKIFQYALVILCVKVQESNPDLPVPYNIVSAHSGEVKKNLDLNLVNSVIVLILTRVKWINLLRSTK
ncbi:MAG TPA: hypothetical protein V6D12_13785 [Candidatus Obscuribacterales bacterium]